MASTRRCVLGTLLFGLAGCLGDDADDGNDDGASGRTGPTVGDIDLDRSFPIVLEDPETGEELANVHYHDEDEGSHWHFQPMSVPLGEERTYRVAVYDADVQRIDHEADPTLEVEFIDDEAAPDIVAGQIDGDTLVLTGTSTGEAEPQLRLRADDGDDWTTPPMLIEVSETSE